MVLLAESEAVDSADVDEVEVAGGVGVEIEGVPITPTTVGGFAGFSCETPRTLLSFFPRAVTEAFPVNGSGIAVEAVKAPPVSMEYCCVTVIEPWNSTSTRTSVFGAKPEPCVATVRDSAR